jgi:hypothetical protein
MNMRMDLSARVASVMVAVAFIAGFAVSAAAQDAVKVLERNEAKIFVPSGFYFEGQSAPTQMRNTGVATLGEKRHVIVGLVDTSGYSADIAAKYEGFFITDSKVKVGGKKLGTGAYGFGFTRDGKVNIHDVGGKTIVTAETKDDPDLKRPRPLMFMVVNGELRFYKGRTYAVISAD